MTQEDGSGLKRSIWADAPRGYNANRPHRWDTPPLPNYHDPTRTSSQPPPSTTVVTNPTTASNPSTTSATRPDFHPATYRPPAPASDLAPAQALYRLEQTCIRLRWKSIDLEASYSRVFYAADHENSFFTPRVAERNFKIDFYEFYAWIEQAIELLHRVFGVQITSSAFPRPGGGGGGGASHAFHHNVLKALAEESNPLHVVMGKGEVNAALWKAKELRNRWKEGGEDVPLGMYDLKWIVARVLEGLEAGYGRALERVQSLGQEGTTGDRQEESWEWMVEESMDLDEV